MQTLVQLCIEATVKFHCKLDKNLMQCLPINLRDKLLLLMCRRGLVTNDNAEQLFHRDTTSLDLVECQIGDRAVEKISICHSLSYLNLNGDVHERTLISSQAVETVVISCPCLQFVSLRSCVYVTDSAIVTLSKHCPKLEGLDISDCERLTNASLESLSKNSFCLKHIKFSKTGISDVGVKSLVIGICAASLQEIVMERCAGITDAAVEAVVSSCPNLTILNFGGCLQTTDRSREILSNHLRMLSKLKQISWTIY